MKKVIVLTLTAMLGMATATAQAQLDEQIDEALIEQYVAAFVEADTQTLFNLESMEDVSFATENEIAALAQFTGCAPNQITAGLCSIFLGTVGVGNFVVGRVGRGVLDILFCWTGIPTVVGVFRGISWLLMTPARWEAKFGCQGNGPSIIINNTNNNSNSVNTGTINNGE